MKAFKIEVLVIDFDDVGKDGIKEHLADARFPNHCLTLNVKSITEKDIGEWTDDHPLNKRATCDSEYQRLFSTNHENQA